MLKSANKQTSQSIVTLLHDKHFLKFLEYVKEEIIDISIKSTKRKDITESRWLQGGAQVLQELINEIAASKERV